MPKAMLTVPRATEQQIASALTDLVSDPTYPCVGAKSVFNRGTADVVVIDQLADPAGTGDLLRHLARFAAAHPPVAESDGGLRLASLVAAFRGPVPSTEAQFEELLWRQLALLREADGAAWDQRVSPDPADPHFGFSAAGRAFFVIGMHPAASRLARRTPLPVLVFNLHDQFDQLRASGQYHRMRDIVRRRDTSLQGDVNPMAADHGTLSEARQYSGRQVPGDWRPPYDLGTCEAKEDR